MEQLYRVENPLNEDLEIMRLGVVYKLPAEGVLENISEDVKTYWNSLHAFLSFRKMPSAPAKVEEKVVVTPKEETIIEGEGVIKDKEVVESKVTKVETKPKSGVADKVIKPKVKK